ncbi:MAG: hypothetical protein AAFR45_02955 [Pseudomonadota bacterium]
MESHVIVSRSALVTILLVASLSACVRVPELDQATTDIRNIDYPALQPLPRTANTQPLPQEEEDAVQQEVAARVAALNQRASRLRNSANSQEP